MARAKPAPQAAWRRALLRRPARDDGTRLLIAVIGGTCQLCPSVRSARYDWERLTRCTPAEAEHRRRTWLPDAHDDDRAARGGCDWCGHYDLGVPLADWEHIESGECYHFRDTAEAWHRRAHATLAASGWPLLAARGTTSFAQRLGFGLPDRAPLAPGAAARPTTAVVRAALAQDFADTFGRWDDEHPGARPGHGPDTC